MAVSRREWAPDKEPSTVDLGSRSASRARRASLALGGAAFAVACGGANSGSESSSLDGSIADATWEAGADSSTLRGDSVAPADGAPAVEERDSSGVVNEGSAGPPNDSGSFADGRPDAPRSDEGSAGDDGGGVEDGPGPACSGAVHSTNAPQTSLPSTPALTVPSGFTIDAVAAVISARELAALPNGDLLVATHAADVYLVPNAEASGAPGMPVKFATFPDPPAQGITFAPSSCTIYVATSTGIYAIPYADGQQGATPGPAIAHVRTGAIAGKDGDVHITTSIAFAGGMLYAGVGSSCDACVETDPTRSTVQVMAPDGANMTTRATRFRNAIALATNPATGTLWAGGAGQDALPADHPYEFFDAVTLHPGIADYGWPDCEENGQPYTSDANCASTVVPLVELPAYSTLIGAAFYPSSPSGAYAFSTAYRGGVFVAAHGGIHQRGGKYVAPPRVAYVPMTGDTPSTAVNWSDPTQQWSDFVTGFQLADGITRIARPTGVAVGSAGSLFVADEQNGYVYRIRPM
jgi:glucose/arabinose dehydrogenase